MSVFIIIFLIVATVFALCTLGYVIVDVILEKRQKEEPEEEQAPKEEEKPAPIVVVAPVVAKKQPEVMPEIVENISAEEADAMISDTLAMENTDFECGAGHGKQDIINIGVLNEHFEANDVITMAVLKEKKLIAKDAGRIKILADGILSKPLTIKAESYSIQAIKMVKLTGGTVIILRD